MLLPCGSCVSLNNEGLCVCLSSMIGCKDVAPPPGSQVLRSKRLQNGSSHGWDWISFSMFCVYRYCIFILYAV